MESFKLIMFALISGNSWNGKCLPGEFVPFAFYLLKHQNSDDLKTFLDAGAEDLRDSLRTPTELIPVGSSQRGRSFNREDLPCD